MSDDEVNAAIFQGRQESDVHRHLVATLDALAKADPGIDPGAPPKGSYFRSQSKQRGLFPDVCFRRSGLTIVLEAQLATISLRTIIKRRSFYDEHGAALLWVTKELDPNVAGIRTSVHDVGADQEGVLFDIPDALIDQARIDRVFRLRAWICGPDGVWTHSIVTIDEAVKLVPVRPPWHKNFKRRWIAEARGKNFYEVPQPVSEAFQGELLGMVRHRFPDADVDADAECLRLANILIAIEAGEVVGYAHDNLVSAVDSALATPRFRRAARLIRAALEYWQPEILARKPIRRKLAEALEAAERHGEPQWTRTDWPGRIRDVLFPEWELPPPASERPS